ncbi:hypothetical protein GF362_03680 [Candidatus Dojkabacteria bacterium]|nr:hypothetical protein [Candidatus Dojkabacteria bacterium]
MLKILCRIILFSFICCLVLLSPVKVVRAVTYPPKDLKIAFIGDTTITQRFRNILRLVQDENTDILIISGDFDYNVPANPKLYEQIISEELGENFPVFVAKGNHDVFWDENCQTETGCYKEIFFSRYLRYEDLYINKSQNDPNGTTYSVEYKGVKFIFAGLDGVGKNSNDDEDRTYSQSVYEPFFEYELEYNSNLWTFCGWHQTQHVLQLGGKGNEMEWNLYEMCRESGAIVANAHEHSYHRTKSLVNFSGTEVDSWYSDMDMDEQSDIRLFNGSTFSFISGIGGSWIRQQKRCLDFLGETCDIWASKYTYEDTVEGEEVGNGVLFFELNVSDPRKGRGYFKIVEGELIDEFDIYNEVQVISGWRGIYGK